MGSQLQLCPKPLPAQFFPYQLQRSFLGQLWSAPLPPSAQSRANQDQGNQGSAQVSLVVSSCLQNLVFPSLSRKAHVTCVSLDQCDCPRPELKTFWCPQNLLLPCLGSNMGCYHTTILAQSRFSAGSVSWQHLTLSPLQPWTQGDTSEPEGPGPVPSLLPTLSLVFMLPLSLPTATVLLLGAATSDKHLPAFYCSQN